MTDDLNARLARIETKLDTFLINQTDQEGRIRNLEARQSALFGGGAIVASILMTAFAYVAVA